MEENITSPIPCSASVDPFTGAKLANFGVTLCIGMFGLVGNTMVVMVNSRLRSFSSTDVYLTSLAVSDNVQILSISCYAYRYVYLLLFPSVEDWTAGGIVSLVGVLIERVSRFINTYIIVVLSLDRYLQVKHISKSKTWCTGYRARRILLALCMTAIIFCLPRFFELIHLIIEHESSIGCAGYFSFTHGISTSEEYRLIYAFIGDVIVSYIIPLSVLTYTSSVLMYTLYKRTRWLAKIHTISTWSLQRRLAYWYKYLYIYFSANRNMARMKKSEFNAILTLLIVTISFILFQIPYLALVFIWRLSPSMGPTASMYAFQILIVNSSVNFIIYSASSLSFRERLIKVLGCGPEDFYGEETMLGAAHTHPQSTQPEVKVTVVSTKCDEEPQGDSVPGTLPSHEHTKGFCNEGFSVASISCE